MKYNIIQKVIANNQNAVLDNELTDPFANVTNVGDLVGFLINIIVGIGWTIVVLYLAYGFIQYITGKGDKEKTSDAQRIITYSIIAGIGLLAVGLIPTLLAFILGEQALQPVQNFLPD